MLSNQANLALTPQRNRFRCLIVRPQNRLLIMPCHWGADFAELFVEKNETNVVSTLSDEVQSVESGINFGIGLRLVYGTKVLYGYTNKTDQDELLRIASVLAAKDLRDPVSTKKSFNLQSNLRHSPSQKNSLGRRRN